MASAEWKTVSTEQVLEFQRKQHAAKKWIETIIDVELDSEDLYEPLKTGVILCYVMKALAPGSIPRIQEETSQLFKLKENIEFFLAACEEMRVPPFKRFKAIDLESKNMVNVVECLVALAEIVEKEFEEAPKLVIDAAWKPPALSDPATIELKKNLSKLRKKPTGQKQAKLSAMIVQKKLQLMAGNGVDVNQYVPGFVRFQSLIRGHIQREQYKKMVRDQAYRDHVAHEILSTEQAYVSNLSACIDIWLAPLQHAIKEGKPIISAQDVRSIFSDIEIIHGFNKQLLSSITNRVEKWHKMECLGDIFLSIMDFLKVYTQYVQNFTTSMSVLENVKKKKSVEAYLQNCKDNPRSNSLDLNSFLIMPVQRIPRYGLLLSDLMKHTWNEHPDSQNLMDASEKIRKIGAFINEKKREAENISKVLQISGNLTGTAKLNLAQPSRRFVREENFNEGTKEELILYLFNDLIIVAKPGKGIIGKGKVAFKEKLELELHDVEFGKGNELDITKIAKKKVVYKLICKNESVRNQWKDEIKKLKGEMVKAAESKESIMKSLKGTNSPKLSAEAQLAMRRKGESGFGPNSPGSASDDESLQKLKHEKESLEKQIAQLNEQGYIGDPDEPVAGGSSLGKKKDKKKKQTKQQKKEMHTLLESLAHDLEVIETKIAVCEEGSKSAAEKNKPLKRKEGGPASSSNTGSGERRESLGPSGLSGSGSITTKKGIEKGK